MSSGSSLEAWTFRPSVSDSWISEAFARDTDALTKALQISLCNTEAINPTSNTTSNTTSNISSLLQFINTETLNPSSSSPLSTTSSETESLSKSSRNLAVAPAGKVTKRKSRASKKSPTTFITADPANFRQMVQEVTGVRFPASSVVSPILKPEPHRPRNGVQGLPTLDSSDFMLNQGNSSVSSNQVNFMPVAEAPALNFQPFQIFPTLESWRVL